MPVDYKTYANTVTALTGSSGFKTYAQTKTSLSTDGYATTADIKNATITVTQGGTAKGSFTLN